MQLPNNCTVGKIGVSPKNWNTDKASLKVHWTINYVFHDNNLKRKKQVIKRVEKDFVTLKQKQGFVRDYIKDVQTKLENGFNPILEDYVKEPEEISENLTYTFKSALQFVFNKMVVVHSTRLDIKSMLNYIYPALERLGFDTMPIEKVARKHIKILFEDLAAHKEKWSGNLHNHYRKYLHKLFADMIDDELLEVNPVTNVKKQKTVINPRRRLTIEEWEAVIKHLNKNYPEFGRFTVMFLLSGSRIIEMLAIRKEDINLYDQEFNVTVKKGKTERREERVIRNEILEHWKYLYNLAKPGEYIFGEGLMPQAREKPIRRDQITRRWEDHVKNKLNIQADIYSLKHSNLTDIAEKISLMLASKAGGHLSPDTTSKYYVQGQKKREHEILKSIPSKFSLN